MRVLRIMTTFSPMWTSEYDEPDYPRVGILTLTDVDIARLLRVIDLARQHHETHNVLGVTIRPVGTTESLRKVERLADEHGWEPEADDPPNPYQEFGRVVQDLWDNGEGYEIITFPLPEIGLDEEYCLRVVADRNGVQYFYDGGSGTIQFASEWFARETLMEMFERVNGGDPAEAVPYMDVQELQEALER